MGAMSSSICAGNCMRMKIFMGRVSAKNAEHPGRLWVSYEPAMGKLRSQKKVYPKILSFCHPKDDNLFCHFCHLFGVSQKVTKVTKAEKEEEMV